MAIQIPRAIYLHVPKTGGTFIRNYFKETGMFIQEIGHEHIHGEDLKRLCPDTNDLVFCFVRHPLTWYISYWTMRQEMPSDRTGGYIDTIIDQPFQQFIEELISNQPGYLTGFFSGYYLRCQVIGKQENLRNDLNNILDLIRLPYNKSYIYERPVDNTTVHKVKYTPELALKVMQSEIELIKRFNYLYIPEGCI